MRKKTNEQHPYPAILTEQVWSIKDSLCGIKKKYGIKNTKSPNFSSWTQRVILSGQDSAILPTWVANHSAGFGSSCPLTEIAI